MNDNTQQTEDSETVDGALSDSDLEAAAGGVGGIGVVVMGPLSGAIAEEMENRNSSPDGNG